MSAPGTLPEVSARVLSVWLSNAAGERIENVEQDTPMYFNCIVEARREMRNPVFGFHFMDADGARIFGFNKRLEGRDGDNDVLRAGDRALIAGEIENRLLPGRYHINCWISRNRALGDIALHSLRLLEFSVYGTEPGPGSVQIHDEVRAEILALGVDP